MPFSPAVHGGVDWAVGAPGGGVMGVLGAGGAHADGRLHGVRGGGGAGHGDWGLPCSGGAALVIILVAEHLLPGPGQVFCNRHHRDPMYRDEQIMLGGWYVS